MPTLDSHKLAELRRTLEQRAQALRAELRQTAEKSGVERTDLLRDDVRDNGDDSFLDLITDVNLADVERDLTELRLVSAALERMNTGEYGSCEDCGREISLARLEVQPFATRCIRCQERYEQLSNQSRTPSL